MNTKNMIIICLAIIILVMAVALGILIGQQGSSHNVDAVSNVTPENNTISNTTPDYVERISTDDVANSNVEEQIDYNSPDSEYYKWDTDGSYHKKEPGMNYIYAQDAVTGEWSYWADKS